MTFLPRMATCVLLGLVLTGCARSLHTDLPVGTDAYTMLQSAPDPATYHIAPLDLLAVTVFLEPQLSSDNVRVTAQGDVALPLVGEIQATGMSTQQLSDTLAQRLARYVVRPQVSVRLIESSTMRVTIEGAVTEPGVYPLTGRTGLLDLIAVAKGVNPTAKLDQAIVLRQVEGAQYGAVFNIAEIRAGRMPDPQLRGGDQVVIGIDAVRENYRTILQTAPFFGAFSLIVR